MLSSTARIISFFTRIFLIHLECIGVYGVSYGYLTVSTSFIKKPITFPAFEISPLTYTKFPYALRLFLGFYSVPLIYLSIPVPKKFSFYNIYYVVSKTHQKT